MRSPASLWRRLCSTCVCDAVCVQHAFIKSQKKKKNPRKPPESPMHYPARNRKKELICLLVLFSVSGAYSRLIVWFQFERSIGFFLIQTYIPAYLIVMLSWIAFWISHNSTPGQCNSSGRKTYTEAWYSNHHFDSAWLILFLTYSTSG